MTNKCVKELVGFINVFRIYPTCFGKWLPSSGVVGALEVTQVISALWVYADYDPYSVASCRGMYPTTTSHTGRSTIKTEVNSLEVYVA
jgi:hypothetical protein